MKKNQLISLSVGIILVILILAAVKLRTIRRYRDNLPGYPDLNGMTEQLKDQIIEADRRAGFNPTAENIGRLGMVYYSGAYYDNASRCFQLAIEKDSTEWIWSYYLGCISLELGKSNEAIAGFRHVVRKDPENLLALYYLAEACHNIGSISDAEKIFRKIAAAPETDPAKPDTIRENSFPVKTYGSLNLARICFETNRYDTAEAILKGIIDRHINFGPAYRLMGNVLTAKGNIISGKKYTIRANDLVSYFPPADFLIDRITLMSRSDVYLMKQIDDALRSLNYNWELKLFAQALKYAPDSKHLLSKVLSGYLYLGYRDKVLPHLDRHMAYFNDDLEELLVFATLLYGNGLRDQAINYFRTAKNLNPRDSRLVLWLIDRNFMDEGILLLNEQLAEDPGNITLITNAVRVFSRVGDKAKAEVHLKYLENDVNSGKEIKKLKGEILENEGRMQEALTAYEDAIKSNPDDLFIIRHLANIYLQNQSWEKLISHYRISLEYLPNEPFLLEGLGKILVFCPQTNLRNIFEGAEYAERAFINYKSSEQIKLSAGKTLTTAIGMSGNKLKVPSYIARTLANKR